MVAEMRKENGLELAETEDLNCSMINTCFKKER